MELISYGFDPLAIVNILLFTQNNLFASVLASGKRIRDMCSLF